MQGEVPRNGPQVPRGHRGIRPDRADNEPLRRVVVSLDQSYEESPDTYCPYEVISFWPRHDNYQPIDSVLACRWEDEEGYSCDEVPDGEHIDHSYQPDPLILCGLGYSEHGRCSWWFSTDHADDHHAGVLRMKDEGDLAWWNARLPGERHQDIDDFLRTYTAWRNGDIYVIAVEEYEEPEACPHCGDISGGWIGVEFAVGGVYLTGDDADEAARQAARDNIAEVADDAEVVYLG